MHGVPPSGGYGYGGGHDAPFGSAHQAPLMPQFPVGGMGGPPMPSMPHDPHHAGGPAAPHSQAPPSGFRVPMNSNSPFPNQNQLGQPPAWDHGGQPLYFASVLFERSVHPAKAGDHLGGKVAVSYGGQEQSAPRFDLLPFDPTTMELIPTSRGQIPHGRRPVEGGYEENGEKLYHAIGQISGVRVPGKTGVHLQGGNFPYGGAEQYLENYELLVWRY
ncbi:hypothetical protein DL96DRAFT_1289785 [Flagelloscypha sp. PMI_526]|nr:hypothetical protein DL96DRAFT_1289785 [Flagelloscypha sp. PMI_526]